MGDDKTIDFMAELDKRKGETYRDIEEDVPDYMKILYGEDASEHMVHKDEQVLFTEDVPKQPEPSSRRNTKAADGAKVPAKKRSLYGAKETDFEALDFEDGVPEKKPKKEKNISEAKTERSAKKAERKRKNDEKLERVINEPMVTKPMNAELHKGSVARGVLISVIAIVLIAVVAVVSVIGISRNSVYTLSYITEGDIVKKGDGNACFIRRGETLYASKSGTFVPNVNEGDKVAAGYIIGYVTDGSYVHDVEKLRNLDKVILSMQNMIGVTDSIDSSELETAENEIAELTQQLSQTAAAGRLTDCNDIMVRLAAALSYRNELLINADSGNASVAKLRDERNALAKRLSECASPVTAQQSGVVSFKISGSESAENDAFNALEAAQGYALNVSALNKDGTITANTEVTSGQAVARVVTSQDYYVVVTADKDYSQHLGKNITLASNAGKYKATGRILSFAANGDGRYNIIIKTNKALKSSLEGATEISFDISQTSGFCVPLSALADWDKPGKTARIALVKAGTVQFVYVSVLDYDEEFAIIKNNAYAGTDIYYGDEPADESEAVFKANDCYVVNAQSVKEGQVIT